MSSEDYYDAFDDEEDEFEYDWDSLHDNCHMCGTCDDDCHECKDRSIDSPDEDVLG